MNLSQEQEAALLGSNLLTYIHFKSDEFNINHTSICIPDGRIVPLKDNYKKELDLFKNEQERQDYGWLIVRDGKLCFQNRIGQSLPLVVMPLPSSSSLSTEIKRVMLIVLDTSGSMGGGRGYNPEATNVGKLGASKHVIRNLISQDPNLVVLVLPFDQTGGRGRPDQLSMMSRWSEPTTNTDYTGQPWYVPRPREEFIAYLNNLRAIGGTPLFEKCCEGLSKAIEIADKYEKEKQMYKLELVILTDGAAGDGEPHCSRAKELVSKFLEVNEHGNPIYSSDLTYYYADGEGGKESALSMGIPPEKMVSFHNNETGINEAGSNLLSRRLVDNQRMMGSNFQNFRINARS